MRIAAVFFDVDFTLIQPGDRFQGPGYERAAARHGFRIDPTRFDAAVAGASAVLEAAGPAYDDAVFVEYTRRIMELMGGEGAPGLHAAARELYDEWAVHHHFSLYDDVVPALGALVGAGIRIGLISNSHRCLATFQSHFELDGLISGAISSPEHGYMKPHPRIFLAALEVLSVTADESVMVGDSLAHDIRGARDVGMHAVLLARRGPPADLPPDVRAIRSLRELPELVGRI